MTTAEKSLKHPVPCIPCSDISEIKEWVNGNGKPGAKTRLALLEDNMIEIKETLKWLRGAVTGLLLTVIGAIIIYIFTNLIPSLLKG